MAAGDLTPIQGIVDVGTVQQYGSNQTLRLSPFRSAFVDQVLPSRAELVRMGKVFSANLGTGAAATGTQSVAQMPTTATIMALWNGNTVASNIHLVILKVSAWVFAGTMGLGKSMICGTSTASQTVVTKGTGAVGPTNNLLTSTNTSNAIIGQATVLGGAPAWIVVAGADSPSAVEIGASMAADVEGLFIVPPGFAFGMHVLGGAGTAPLYLGSVCWAELALTAQ
jgi:hypothetical protein